jgi:WD40 repeat protein
MPLGLRRLWCIGLTAAALGSFALDEPRAIAIAGENAAEKRVLQGHTSIVTALAITTNGQTLASGSDDNTIKLWDVATGQERMTLRAHSRAVEAIALTRDGTTLASSSREPFVILWNLSTGKERRIIKAGDPVWCLAFTPDGATLITGGEGRLRAWDVATGREAVTFGSVVSEADGKPLPFSSVAIMADGKTLCSGHEDGTIRLWELATGKVKKVFRVTTARLECVVLSPDNQNVGYVLSSGRMGLWDLAAGKPRLRLAAGRAKAWCLAYSPSGKMIASGGWDGKIRLWDTTRGRLLSEFPAHKDWRVHALAFTPDGQTLFSGAGIPLKDGELKRWDVFPRLAPRRTR